MNFTTKIIIVLILNTLLFWALDTKLLPNHLVVTGGNAAYFYIAFLFLLLNLIIRPIVELLSLPFEILTLGAFVIIINGFMLWVLEYVINFVDLFGVTFDVKGFFTYLFIGTLLTVFNSLFHLFKS